MNFAFTAEQEMLRDSVRSFIETKVPMARVREAMETEIGFDADLWAEMAQMGWPAMHIPEESGGAGFTMLELGIVLEEMGRALTPAPLFSSIVLGANLLMLAGSAQQKAQHLPGIAAGETTMAVAIVEPSGGWSGDDVTVTAAPDGDEVVLSGVKTFVVDGHTADLIAVVAVEPDGGVGFYLVPAKSGGVTAHRIETLDMTRKQAEVRLEDVRVDKDSRLAGDGRSILADLYDLSAVGLAFEQVGGAARCLEMSVGYAKDRFQFGRPIGSFQAIKHMCADMLVSVESARSSAYYAGWAASEDPEELRIVAPLAKSYCSDAYFEVAGDTIQVHGGIGFTWEHDAHLYFKRAKSSQLMFGSPTAWRAELADRIGL